MKTYSSNATMLLLHYLKQEPDLLDGHSDCTKVVPFWFEDRNKMQPFPIPRPEFETDNPIIEEYVKAWNNDPVFTLSDDVRNAGWGEDEVFSVQMFQTKIDQWYREKRQWELSQELTLLRKWIYWLTRFTWMDLFDNQVMEMAGLVEIDNSDIIPQE